MIAMNLVPQADYDKSVRIGGQTLACYSGKKLAEISKRRTLHPVGEACKKNRKAGTAQLTLSEEVSLPVSACATPHNRLLYARVGYVCVSEDSYVVLLKSRLAFLIAVVVLLAAIAVAANLLLGALPTGSDIPILAPTNPLPDPDPNIQPLPSDGNNNPSNNSQGGGSVSMIYSLSAKMSAADGSITILFKNPAVSNQDVVLQMYIPYESGDIKVAESGRIPSGHGLYTMKFLPNSAVLKEGTYSAYYKVIYYDSDSGERALVETKIDDLALEVRN